MPNLNFPLHLIENTAQINFPNIAYYFCELPTLISVAENDVSTFRAPRGSHSAGSQSPVATG